MGQSFSDIRQEANNLSHPTVVKPSNSLLPCLFCRQISFLCPLSAMSRPHPIWSVGDHAIQNGAQAILVYLLFLCKTVRRELGKWCMWGELCSGTSQSSGGCGFNARGSTTCIPKGVFKTKHTHKTRSWIIDPGTKMSWPRNLSQCFPWEQWFRIC